MIKGMTCVLVHMMNDMVKVSTFNLSVDIKLIGIFIDFKYITQRCRERFVPLDRSYLTADPEGVWLSTIRET